MMFHKPLAGLPGAGVREILTSSSLNPRNYSPDRRARFIDPANYSRAAVASKINSVLGR